ncbi:MAG: hypothetical protein WC414_03625 [Patescibacteria group bacterium]
MISKEARKRFLEILRKTPIIQLACERSGISRASLYRWKKEDPVFALEVDEAVTEGSGLITDIAESQLLQAIKERNITAVMFWLKHHHKAYANKIELSGNLSVSDQLTPEQEELVKKALELASFKNNPKENV